MSGTPQILTKADLADLLERFIGDAPGCGEWEWDDFTSVRSTSELEPYRQRLAEVDPPKGQDVIRHIILELRANA
jgi:hypothetical protein